MTLFIQWNINGFYKRSVGINRIIYDLQLQYYASRKPILKAITQQVSKITPVILKTEPMLSGQAVG